MESCGFSCVFMDVTVLRWPGLADLIVVKCFLRPSATLERKRDRYALLQES